MYDVQTAFQIRFFQTIKICSNIEKMAHEEPDKFSYPVVIHGRLASTWEPLAWSLDQWAALLSAARPVICVRVGQSRPSYRHPQWERFTHTESLAAERLFQPDYWDELIKEGRWAYFDYKYMQVCTFRSLHSHSGLKISKRDYVTSWIFFVEDLRYTIKSVLSVHAQMVFKFLACLVQEKN